MITNDFRLGLFGKMPSQGDFYQKALPAAFVRVWDDWLSRGLVLSQQAIGSTWPQAYLLSPPWRFALAPGVIDGACWCGVLVSSIDKVNRFFPLTLAMRFEDHALFERAAAHEPLFRKLEGFAFALIDGRTVEDVLPQADGDVQAIVRGLADSTVQRFIWNGSGDAWLAIGSEASAAIAPAYHALARKEGTGFSWWWHDDWEPHARAAMASRGLPPPEGFAAMLDGQWARYGWANLAAG